MMAQWNKGHNWKRRELKKMLAAVESADEYDEMAEVTGQMWPITATLPENDGARIYYDQAVELCEEQKWSDMRDDALWEVYGYDHM
jgi:hypothetical protein